MCICARSLLFCGIKIQGFLLCKSHGFKRYLSVYYVTMYFILIYKFSKISYIWYQESTYNHITMWYATVYGLKQASRQCYLKFDEIMILFGFIENKIDQCIYLKVCGTKFIFLVLYVDDIFLGSSELNMLHETKQVLSKTFDMKDLCEASFMLGIWIHKDRLHRLLELSQKAYIEPVYKRFNMQSSKSGDGPINKEDVLINN